MTLQEYKQRKRELEKQIIEVIRAFESETDTEVTYVKLEHMGVFGQRRKNVFEVRVETEI